MGSRGNNVPFTVVEGGSTGRCGDIALTVFGKTFVLDDLSPVPRVVWHPDFAMITPEDMAALYDHAKGQDAIVMTARRACPHPYRLLTENGGKMEYVFAVDQRVRGFRQKYPEVLSFVPALLYIPPHVAAARLADPETFTPFLMAEEKLLDKTRLLDLLAILIQEEEAALAGNRAPISLDRFRKAAGRKDRPVPGMEPPDYGNPDDGFEPRRQGAAK